MPFDSVSLRSVTEDVNFRLVGGRVDRIVQPAVLDVAIEMRSRQANHWLVLSAHAQQARVHLTQHKQSGAFGEPSAFVMLLRKYLEGARLHEARQQGVDRVLHLLFHGALGELFLVAEVMGRYSNTILVDRDMQVMGAVKHVRADENRVRVVLPHHRYVPPPRPMQPAPRADRPKLDPLSASAAELAAALAGFEAADTLWKALLDLVDGVSPTVAREAVFRAGGSVGAAVGGHSDLESAAGLLYALRDLFSPERGRPSAVWNGGKLSDWAAFPLTQYGDAARPYPDVGALLDASISERTVDPLAGRRGPLLQSIEAQLRTLRRKIASLEATLIPRQALDAMRQQGEMVLAYQHSIEAGQRELQIPELSLSVALDPALTALENAQRFFKRYQKARDATAVVPELLESAQQDRAYLEQLAVHAAQATDPAALAAVRDEWRETQPKNAAAKKVPRQSGRGHPGKDPRARASAAPLRVRAADGTEILVGRSARQNEALTFNLADHRDLWMHARQIPGAHVIVRTAGHAPSDEALARAAGLAAYYSQARESTVVPVDCTAVRNVRRIKGGKPGLVHYSGETTLNARPLG